MKRREKEERLKGKLTNVVASAVAAEFLALAESAIAGKELLRAASLLSRTQSRSPIAQQHRRAGGLPVNECAREGINQSNRLPG